MMKTERYSTVPNKDTHVDIINIKGIEDIGYMQQDIIVSHDSTLILYRFACITILFYFDILSNIV